MTSTSGLLVPDALAFCASPRPQAAVYFGYQGFSMHEDNTELDPIAFRLAFGVIVVLILMKNAQIFTGNVNYLAVWQILTCLMVIGHFYGSVRNFLWLYDQEFPYFLGRWSEPPLPQSPRREDARSRISPSISVSLPLIGRRIWRACAGDQADEEHGFCFRGEFFMGTVSAVVYLICSSYFLYTWKRHRVEYALKFGVYKEKPSLDELMEQVDEKMQKYSQ